MAVGVKVKAVTTAPVEVLLYQTGTSSVPQVAFNETVSPKQITPLLNPGLTGGAGIAFTITVTFLRAVEAVSQPVAVFLQAT